MNEEKSALPMTRGQIENFIKRNGKNLFYSLIYDFTTASMTKSDVKSLTCKLGEYVYECIK